METFFFLNHNYCKITRFKIRIWSAGPITSRRTAGLNNCIPIQVSGRLNHSAGGSLLCAHSMGCSMWKLWRRSGSFYDRAAECFWLLSHWAAVKGMNRAQPPTLCPDFPLIDSWWEVSEGSFMMTPPDDCVWLMKHSIHVLHLLKLFRFYWAIWIDFTNRSQFMFVRFHWTFTDSISC